MYYKSKKLKKQLDKFSNNAILTYGVQYLYIIADEKVKMNEPRLKQEFVRETVREWILSGKLRPGEQLPPDEKLSKQFQLNCRTIAAGLNQLVREELLERAPRKGTVVKQQVKKNGSNAVALIAQNWGDVFSEMARTVNRGLMTENLYPVFIDQNFVNNTEEVICFLDRLTAHHQPYGFLAIGDYAFPYEYVKEHAGKLSNFIFLFNYHYAERLPHAKYVLTDYDSLGHQTVRYFAEKGVRDLAFVPQRERKYCGVHSSIQVQIFSAMQKYAGEYGVTVNESLFWRCHAGAQFEDLFPDLQKTSGTMPQGYFSMDSNLVDTVYSVLESAGITPVEDCPVLGYYNTHRAAKYGFDSFDIRPGETVEQALHLLFGKTAERVILIQPEIIYHSGTKKS